MTSSAPGWRLAVALLALSAIPLTAGSLRLLQLAGGPELMPTDDRYPGFPVALVLHIVASGVYAVLGVLQLLARFRRRHPAWHRRAGRVLVLAGLVVVGSALWLTLGHPAEPGSGPLLFVSRIVVGSSMGACLVLGLAAIRRLDVPAHRAWTVRAYALGLGAGTQAFTEGLSEAVLGTGEVRGDAAALAGWVVNLLVAEWALRRAARSGGPSAHPRPVGAVR